MLLVAALAAVLASGARPAVAEHVPLATVQAYTEIEPVPTSGDAADDPAIWVDSADPARSLVLGTDKAGGGLAVHDLDGKRLAFQADVRPNNVDVRGDLVAVSDVATRTIALYAVDPSTRTLHRTDVRPLASGIGVRGLCLHRDASGRTFAFVGDSSGSWEQWQLQEVAGGWDGHVVRRLVLASPAEGCVADDATGALYIAEEATGIWRFDAAPEATTPPVLVAGVGGGHLTADVEGLAIHRTPTAAYLVASSQGDDTFAVYDLASGVYMGSFAVTAGAVDAVTHTDGIDITSAALDARTPTGLVVVQDDRNDGGNQSFKLVAWSDVAAAFSPPLAGRGPARPVADLRRRFVDSRTGDDAADGSSPASAWRTLARAARSLSPGVRLSLARGATWTEPLDIGASGTSEDPVIVDAYGTGTPPRITGVSTCVAVLGSWVTVRGLHADGCSWAGVSVAGTDVRLEASTITGNAAGVYLQSTARRAVVVRNRITDNNRMSVLTPEPGGDSGAFGVLVHGDDNDIGWNHIEGSDAFSFDYGRDGAAVEIVGGRANVVHHNVAVDNDAFAELGGARAGGNSFVRNVVRSSLPTSVFLVTRGAQSSFGPVSSTQVLHNTVSLTGASSQGIVCHDGCGPGILTLRGNVITAIAKAGYADAPFDEDADVFWGGPLQLTPGPRTLVADPQLRDPASGDLRLTRGSPAIDRAGGTIELTEADGSVGVVDGDGDGTAAADAGAYEYGRRAGPDRFATAAALASEAFTVGVDRVYLATGTDFADALAVTALTARQPGALLLTLPCALPAPTAEALDRLHPIEVVVMGGTSAVCPAIAEAAAVRTGASVTRVAGADRFATATALSRLGWSGADQVVLASGTSFADALAGGPAAARLGAPLLLTERCALPRDTAAELQRLRPSRVVVLGGAAAVCDELVHGIRSFGTGVERIAGADRYATAATAARALWPDGAPAVYVATGASFPDGLAAGVAAARAGSPILLTEGCAAPEVTLAALTSLRPTFATVAGGEAAICSAAATAIHQRVRAVR